MPRGALRFAKSFELLHLWVAAELRISWSSCKFFFERFSLVIDTGMARVRLTVKDISEGAGSGEEKDHISEEKDLSNVDADLPN